MHIITENDSIGHHYMAELRDVNVQRDSLRFRKNLERIGELLAYEISKHLEFKDVEITTPLGTSRSRALSEQPILATVLRAGIPMYQGFLNVFDKSESAFTGVYRQEAGEQSDQEIQVSLGYMVAPDLNGKTLILIDPMLATGRSLVRSYEEFLKNGNPRQVFVATAIASQQGVDYLLQHIPQAKLFLGDVDPELDSRSYIVPGLGDAGDLAFGNKL